MKLDGKTITIGILLVILATVAINTMLEAQAPVPQKGFWYFKRKPLPEATKVWDRMQAEQYLDRLQQEAIWIVDEVGITDIVGNDVDWTQVEVDGVLAEIAVVQQLLIDLP